MHEKETLSLCATEKMTVYQLRSKLEWLADSMSGIRGAQGAL